MIDKLKDSHLRELLRGGSVALVLRMTGMLTGYVFTLLISRSLGAGAVGVFALSLTVLTVFSVAGRLGLDTALLRFVAEYTARERTDLVWDVYLKAIKVVVPLTVLLSCSLFFSSTIIAEHVFHKEFLGPSFMLVSFAVLPMVLIFINSESLRGLKKIREYVFLQNVAVFLFASMILSVALLFTRSERIPVIAYVMSLFIVSALSLTCWLRSAGLNGHGRGEGVELRPLLKVSLPLLLSGSLFLIMQWTDTIMLGVFRTEVEVGIYNIALKVAGLTSVALFAVNSIAAPKFAEFYGRGDIEGLGRVARQSTKLIFWISFPVLLVFLLFPSDILGVFGGEFKAGVYVLIILTLGQFVNAISGSVGYILQMTGRQKVFQNIILAASIINIVLNVLLIPRYGMNGAAFASMVSMGFWNLSSVLYLKLHFNFSTLYLPMLRT